MKYLVFVFCLLAATKAVPITPGYGTPLAPVVDPAPLPVVPVETINLPVVGAPIVEPQFVRTIQRDISLPTQIVPRTVSTTVPIPTPIVPVARALPPVSISAPITPVARSLPPVSIPAPITPVARALPPVSIPAPITSVARALPPVASTPSSQFQAQDELGGFSFGYQNVNSAKEEVRTADGITRGVYSYIDANGLVQRVEYVADPVNGFQVIGTNIPVVSSSPIADTPEVALAKAEFKKAFDEAVSRNAKVDVLEQVTEAVGEPIVTTIELRKKRSTTTGYGVPLAPVLAPIDPVPIVNTAVIPRTLPTVSANTLSLTAGPVVTPNALPLAVGPVVTPNALPLAARPVVASNVLPLAAGPVVSPNALPLAAVPQAVISSSSQYQAQDEFGGVSFGYKNENSARQEVRDANGNTQGSYSYVDANGITQTVNYIADALGFRVTGTNLPVAA